MTSFPPQQQQQQTTYVTQGYVINVPSNAGVEKYVKDFLILVWILIFWTYGSLKLGTSVFEYALSNSSYYVCNEYGYHNEPYAFIGTGIWYGVIFVSFGLLGVLSGKKKAECLIRLIQVIAGVVMMFFLALAAVTLFSLKIAGAIYAANYIGSYYNYYHEAWRVTCRLQMLLGIVVYMTFIGFGVCSNSCCRANCGPSATTTTAPRTTHAYVNPMGGQVTALPGQQAAFVQGPPSIPVSGQPYQQHFIMTSAVAQPPINYQIQPVQQAYMVPQSQLQPQQPEQQQSGQTGQTPPPDYQEQHATKPLEAPQSLQSPSSIPRFSELTLV